MYNRITILLCGPPVNSLTVQQLMPRQDRDEADATYSIRRVLHLLSEVSTVFNTRERRSCWQQPGEGGSHEAIVRRSRGAAVREGSA